MATVMETLILALLLFFGAVFTESDLGKDCSADTDCSPPEMICLSGKCKCKPGFSYNFDSEACQNGCTVYGTTYQDYVGAPDGSYASCLLFNGRATLESCLESCSSPDSHPSCLLAFYFFPDSLCYLLDCLPQNYPDRWSFSESLQAFVRNCGGVKECELGQYYEESTDNCEDCEPGSFSNSTTSSTCTPCPAGHQQTSWGASGCDPCEAHKVSGAGEPICRACPGGKEPNENQSDCVACPAGTFSHGERCTNCESNTISHEGSYMCENCGPGKVPNQNQSECTDCEPGYYSSGGKALCTKCDPGFYTSLPGQSSCKVCPAGKIPNAQQTACDACSAGSFSNPVAGVSAVCTPCDPGYYSSVGQGYCEPCPNGKIPNSAKSGCIECPAGTFSNMGDENCTQCAAGTVAIAGQDSCLLCPPGKAPNEQQSVCIVCLAGTFSADGIECAECPSGSVSLTGQVNCSLCGDGMVPNYNKSECVNCPAGEYSIAGMAACVPCDSGKYSVEGQGHCSQCNDGMVPNSQQSGCISCEPGTYAVSGEPACSPCLNGTHSKGGLAGCVSCDAGFYPNEDKSDCDPCPPGSRSSSGDAYCTPCDQGFYSPGGQAECMMCDGGSIPNADKSDCVLCQAGSYANPGDSSCSECGPDLVSSAGASGCTGCPVGFVMSQDKTSCWENLAYEKETMQWFTNGPHHSGRAVDGRYYYFCSRTKKRENPWWLVKLDGLASITHIAIQNRKDCCGQQLHDIDVFVGQTEDDRSVLCGSYKGPADTGERVYIPCTGPAIGLYVTIVKNTQGQQERLTLCEVFVHGKRGKTCSTRHVTNKGTDQPGHLCQRNGRQQTTISLFTIVHVSYTHPIRGEAVARDGVCARLNPCRHGGTCTNKGEKDYDCCCPQGWTGKNCEEELPTKPEDPSLECINDLAGDMTGVGYAGTRSKTTSGLTCQRWDSIYPHSHPLFRRMGLEENFCRNRLDGKAGRYRPWCYTKDVNKVWEYCDNIPLCSNPDEIFPDPPSQPGCYIRKDKGKTYTGPVDFTASGKRCAKWKDEPHNYCRNPAGERNKPWCWTRDGKIEECDIEICALPPPVPGDNVCSVENYVSGCENILILTGNCHYTYEVHEKCNITIVRVNSKSYDVYLPYAVEQLHWLNTHGPKRHTSKLCDVILEVTRLGQFTMKTPTCGWCFAKTFRSYMKDVQSNAKICPEPTQDTAATVMPGK